MCNLYRMSKSQDEVADFFRAMASELAIPPAGNAPAMIYPGYPGIVFTGDALLQMVWGFPLQRKGAKGQPLKPKPVNNARSDKLSSPFWAASFRERRCLIPVGAFAEAEGQKGAMTRTWFAMPDGELMAIAGLWRNSAEWDAAYTMVMTQANETIAPIHNRMPVILPRESWASWLGGDAHEAAALCQPYEDSLKVTRTDTPWFARSAQS